MFVTLDDTRKNDLSSSSKQLFIELFVSIDLSGPKNFFYHLHIICQNTFWTLMSCCLTYVMCNNTRKSRPNIFHDWKDCLFFKTFHFQQPIRTWKSPYKFQSKWQNSLWTLITRSLMFVTLDDTRKNDLLSSWKQLFFEMFVSIDLLGPKKWTYHLHNIRQNTLWTLINCCLAYVMCDNTKKSRPNIFHHWEDCLFFKTFYFQQPIRS